VAGYKAMNSLHPQAMIDVFMLTSWDEFELVDLPDSDVFDDGEWTGTEFV